MAGTTPPVFGTSGGQGTPKTLVQAAYCAPGKGKTLCPANGAFKQKAPAASQRLPQGLSPFCAESAGTLLAPQKKTLYFFAGFRYTETNGRKQSL